MCNRMARTTDIRIITSQYGVLDVPERMHPRDNIKPTERIDAIALGKDGKRKLIQPHWGIVPRQGGKMIPNTTNATKERLLSSNLWRPMFLGGRRCLIPFDCFYEWSGPKNDRQPNTITTRASNRAVAFAGLWGLYNPRADMLASEAEKRPKVDVCAAIITVPANETMAAIHDRMPAILTEDNFPLWLGETAVSDTELRDMLRPYPPELTEVTPGAPFKKTVPAAPTLGL